MSLSDDQTIINNNQQHEESKVSNEGFSQLKTTISNKGADRDEAMSLVGCTLGNRYQINEEIGKGGFGKVYLALDSKLRRIVAVKLLSPIMSSSSNFDEIFARFEQEAITIANFSHQNIVHVYDYDKDAIYGAYIVMEYIDGKSLSEKIKSSGKFDTNLTLKIITEVANGLNYAHKKGIIHRDIKPGNILLTKDNIAKIVDFGLAHTESSFEYSTSGVAMGTLNYMSPEQQKDAKNVDKTADIYALGKVLYEILTGKSPTSIIPKYIPEGFDNIIYKCIDPEPENRYLSADDLLADLNSLQIKKIPNQAKSISSADSISNKIKCQDCGAFNNEDARHCAGCGAGLIFSCPECKKEIQTNTKFCPSCGSNVVEYIQTIDLFKKLQTLYQDKKNEEILQFKEEVNNFKTSGKRGEKIKNELIKIVEAAENNIQTAKTICDIDIPNAVKNINLAKLYDLINHYNEIVILDTETEKIFQAAKDKVSQIVEQYICLLKECQSALDNQNYESVLSFADKINQFKPEGVEEQKIKQAIVKIFEEAKQKKIKIDKIKNNLLSEVIKKNNLDAHYRLLNEYKSLTKWTDDARHKFDDARNIIVNNLIDQSVTALDINKLKNLTKYLTTQSLISPEIKRLLIKAEKQIYTSFSKDYVDKMNSIINAKEISAAKQLFKTKAFKAFYEHAQKNDKSFTDFLELNNEIKKLVALYNKRLKIKLILISIVLFLAISGFFSYFGYNRWQATTLLSKAENQYQTKKYQLALSNANSALKYCMLNKNQSKKITDLIGKISAVEKQVKYDTFISNSQKLLANGNYSNAFSTIEKAILLLPNNTKAIDLKKIILKKHKQSIYNNLIQTAEDLFKQNEYSKALICINKAKECNVRNSSKVEALEKSIKKSVNNLKFNKLLEEATQKKVDKKMVEAAKLAAKILITFPSKTNNFYEFLTKTIEIGSHKLDFIWIPGDGNYLTATTGFWISKTEIPNNIFSFFVNSSSYKPTSKKDNRSFRYDTEKKAWNITLNKGHWNTFYRKNYPVVCVSWHDADEFCKWLSAKTKLKFSLPTSKQWKTAAAYPDYNNIEKAAWYFSNSKLTTHKVASLNPNKFGVYDMYGNVWEWCKDSYIENRSITNAKYICGGSWSSDSDTLKNNCIRGTLDSDCFDACGFRIIATNL